MKSPQTKPYQTKQPTIFARAGCFQPRSLNDYLTIQPTNQFLSTSRISLTGSARPSSFKPVEAHGYRYYRAWVRPLPPRAASRLSGRVRRLRCFVPKQRHAQCRADLGQGPGHTLQNVHTTNFSPTNQPKTKPLPVNYRY